MYKFFVILFLMLGNQAFSQLFYNGFEEGELEGWTNSDGTTNQLSVEGTSFNYLQKVADGSNTAMGHLSIVNASPEYWAGDYFYTPFDTQALRTIDDINVKNPNNFDLYLRYGFTGANGYTVVTTNPIVVPSQTDWEIYTNFYGIDEGSNVLLNLTVLNDTSGMPWEEVMQHVYELFQDVVEIKIFHNPNISYEGLAVEGLLQIESIISWELLSNASFSIPQATIYPNPVYDAFQVNSNTIIKSILFYNAQGAKIREYKLNATRGEFDISSLVSGVYMLEITFEDGSKTSKKMVKE
ncbi:MAG TPA: T9SS type A sorting domain-containing protein [Flavobacteriaceae bacterium]|nr:T9SS type A sorting domain-containing protein [Flavobacteriaceae bacterium]HPF11279.1 T9SS type A sorting domain-containing protein [Flavobacteriaceae bacterium]HQU22397.1 T9SS type A sorting domain-containing protein [Flavobacteriaceae bacterium]HQU64502.1 T9SS type A sorting domain-containing protein [Flavobacteriaceae bacterium]HRW44633.1 T9SS type A sorting domain-containing protein [Flavobacteriaceae bacterium]